ncbi:MAG: CorA family divalent cation transporter [Erysipelotrichaceae bacterium]
MYYTIKDTITKQQEPEPFQSYQLVVVSLDAYLQNPNLVLGESIAPIQVNDQEHNIITYDGYYVIQIHKEHVIWLVLSEERLAVIGLSSTIEQALIHKIEKSKQQWDSGMLTLQILEMILTNEQQEITLLEQTILSLEQRVLANQQHHQNTQFLSIRKSLLLQLNKYDQISSICEELVENEMQLFSSSVILGYEHVISRYTRYSDSLHMLSEYLSEVMEIAQAQVAIEQNEVMKLFTVLAAVFMPPTLLVGWYGMNFKHMPELNASWGYPGVIVASLVLVLGILAYMKYKRYF